MKRIAVLTSGGDAPGMNAAIRAVTRAAVERGVDVFGVRRGYAGLIEADFIPLSARSVGGMIDRGGTFLESARCSEFKTDEGQERALSALKSAHIEGLVVIGGNGSQTGTHALHRRGFPVCGVASTIDNDLCGSEITIGVDTALNIALESIDRLRTTASSHHRLFVVEVMGRDCGYLALTAGIAGGAEVIVTPEFDLTPGEVLERIHEMHRRGKFHCVVVVAEGAKNKATAIYDFLCGDQCPLTPRLTVLGHVQRGGRPTAFDRLLATRFGAAAVTHLLDGRAGNLIGLRHGEVGATPLEEVVGRTKPLPQELLDLASTMTR